MNIIANTFKAVLRLYVDVITGHTFIPVVNVSQPTTAKPVRVTSREKRWESLTPEQKAIESIIGDQYETTAWERFVIRINKIIRQYSTPECSRHANDEVYKDWSR